MLQFLSQQTILFYTMALICAWGVISQVVLRSMYGNLLRDVRRQGMAKGKFMKQLRQRYQNVCRMKQNTVNAFNTEAFIRKNLLEYRLFGGSLHTWKRMAQMPYYVQHWERSDGISASRRRLAACVRLI